MSNTITKHLANNRTITKARQRIWFKRRIRARGLKNTCLVICSIKFCKISSPSKRLIEKNFKKTSSWWLLKTREYWFVITRMAITQHEVATLRIASNSTQTLKQGLEVEVEVPWMVCLTNTEVIPKNLMIGIGLIIILKGKIKISKIWKRLISLVSLSIIRWYPK